MRILIALMLLILVSGGFWIVNYEKKIIAVTPCESSIDGQFVARKDCPPDSARKVGN